MDSLTHIALGAVVGEVCAGKRLGKKALLFGAIFQSIPDIDFLGAFFLAPTANLLAHRGFTHSILFGLLIATLLSYLFSRWNKTSELDWKQWFLFIGIEIFIHLFLDACNAYGVGWFEPFSYYRISFNIIFVADPLYSLWPGIAAIALFLLPVNHMYRKAWARFGLLVSTIYLTCCLINKTYINQKVKEMLVHNQITYTRYFTTPIAFNNLLWYCVAETEAGYYIGYRSVFDTSDNIRFTFFPQQRWLLNGIENEEEVGDLLRFSQGFYTVEKEPDALVFNDLRFGRVAGWENDSTEFTFHYYLQQPGKNALVVQRGRFAELNLKTVQSLFRRIEGE